MCARSDNSKSPELNFRIHFPDKFAEAGVWRVLNIIP